MFQHISDILRKFWYVNFRHTRKNSHLAFYVRSFIRYYTPKRITRSRLNSKLAQFESLSAEEKDYVKMRVDYYCRFNDAILLPDDAPALKLFTYGRKESYVHDYVNSTYFFDAYEYTRFFPDHLRWAYNPAHTSFRRCWRGGKVFSGWKSCARLFPPSGYSILS